MEDIAKLNCEILEYFKEINFEILEICLFLQHKTSNVMEENKVFKRKIYSKLLEWKQEENGKKALLVKGARRVGKSTIVEEFARNEYK